MESIVDPLNLECAMARVIANDGAPGVDVAAGRRSGGIERGGPGVFPEDRRHPFPGSGRRVPNAAPFVGVLRGGGGDQDGDGCGDYRDRCVAANIRRYRR